MYDLTGVKDIKPFINKEGKYNFKIIGVKEGSGNGYDYFDLELESDEGYHITDKFFIDPAKEFNMSLIKRLAIVTGVDLKKFVPNLLLNKKFSAYVKLENVKNKNYFKVDNITIKEYQNNVVSASQQDDDEDVPF